MTPELIQTAPQFRQRLWADAASTVYAVALGSRFPGLPERLEAALRARELADYDCLWPGAIAPARQREAPYLMQLQPQSAFSDWLLFEAAAGFGSWGVVLRAPVGRLVLRSHLRQLLRARLLDGSVVALDWMDPEVLALLLPRFDPAGLLAFAGPVTDWLMPGSGQWQWSRTAAGRLDQQLLRLHPAR
jgi:Domain of unknown function (DUF4123)